MTLYSLNQPKTHAARKAMATHGKNMAADLVFLEHWESTPVPTTSSLLRALQIKKANPELMQAISNEIKACTKPSCCNQISRNK
ncbi:hypothetical protein [Entomobacter blattae]|uniref:Uncharacterized protein n=1 Tax=Entomobacter blattae TaxID=2762277 RepID=A0A7H1NPC7_9PROT|nr:hypothetical protein [Entomobacter blattae]QNT77637.1 hypothetical protein JGUZn3_03860 [Entomobacter blattae]